MKDRVFRLRPKPLQDERHTGFVLIVGLIDGKFKGGGISPWRIGACF